MTCLLSHYAYKCLEQQRIYSEGSQSKYEYLAFHDLAFGSKWSRLSSQTPSILLLTSYQHSQVEPPFVDIYATTQTPNTHHYELVVVTARVLRS